MRTGVVYLNHDSTHLVRLAVSLWSLRRHYGGEIVIAETGYGDRRILDQIARDPRIDARTVHVVLAEYGVHKVFVTKTRVWSIAGLDCALQVDADTVFRASPQPLIDMAADPGRPGMVLTPNSFASAGLIRRAVATWRNMISPVFPIRKMANDYLADQSLPRINAGVLAWRTDSEFLDRWTRLTHCGVYQRLTDEIAAHLLMTTTPFDLAFPGDDRWNALPGKTQWCPAGSELIQHYHGSRHMPDVDEVASAAWVSSLADAYRANVAGIQHWNQCGELHRFAEAIAYPPESGSPANESPSLDVGLSTCLLPDLGHDDSFNLNRMSS